MIIIICRQKAFRFWAIYFIDPADDMRLGPNPDFQPKIF